MSKTIVITGANRGIGLELTRVYSEAGHSVVACVRDPAAATALQDLASRLPVRVVELHVADPESGRQLSDALAGQAVDVLINNAGINGKHQTLDDMDYDEWREQFEINTIAPFRLIAALLPNLSAAKAPKAMTVTSQMGSFAQSNAGAYAYRSSKAAANKLMQGLAAELEPRGIVVCALHPGWVRTDMGGPSAFISVEESAAGLYTVIEGLDMSGSGRFWTWDGKDHPW